MLNVLFIGSKSQIGKEFRLNSNKKSKFIFLNRKQLDITNLSLLKKTINKIKPQLVINFAAYTEVDNAESNKKKSNAINSIGPKNLSKLCNKIDSTLVHISTDYVFSGKKKSRYVETNIARPLSHYGYTKLQGEKEIKKNIKKYFIIRVSGLFSEFNNNFVKTVLIKLKKNENLKIINNQYFSPTSTRELKRFINYFIDQKLYINNYGTYHFSDDGTPITWYEFARFIKNLYKKKYYYSGKIEKVDFNQYKFIAKRPQYSALNTLKLKKTFNFFPKNWRISTKYVVNSIIKE